MYGNGSSGNHGCEAIVRGTVQLLGDNSYHLLSEKCPEDSQYELDRIVTLSSAKNDRKKDLRFLKAYMKLKLTGNYTEMDGLCYLPAIHHCKEYADVALSIGGDNYCYGNTHIYAYLNRAFIKQGIKTVLWGCSIEPNVVAEPSVSQDLQQYSLIVARESITYKAVKASGANVVQMPDPAFHMKPEAYSLDERFFKSDVIGINISPMVIHNEKTKGAAYANYNALIQYILDNTDAYIALIPHVVWASNDDRIPLQQLYDDFNHDPRLILVDDHNAPQLKYIISKCSFFIGARTHATIAAYSTGVPTLVVGYSVKARGIARDLFGTEDGYVLPVQQLKEGNELSNAFAALYDRRQSIHAHLNAILPAYISHAHDARKALEALANI